MIDAEFEKIHNSFFINSWILSSLSKNEIDLYHEASNINDFKLLQEKFQQKESNLGIKTIIARCVLAGKEDIKGVNFKRSNRFSIKANDSRKYYYNDVTLCDEFLNFYPNFVSSFGLIGIDIMESNIVGFANEYLYELLNKSYLEPNIEFCYDQVNNPYRQKINFFENFNNKKY